MFKTGTPVTGEHFIDRRKHLPLFKTYIDNNQNIMIKAPRRFGKTSLVKHLLENKKEYNYVYIDINLVSSLKSLADKIIDSAYKLSNIDNFVKRAKHSLYELVKSIKSIDAGISDIIDISIEFNQSDDSKIDEVAYCLHALDVLQVIATKKNINIKCVFDEFQDILKIASSDILDKTRSTLQHHTNVTYIFLGSIESIMTKIFENKNSAFFHFAKIILLPPLDINELYQYAKDVFKQKTIVCENLYAYINFLGGHPDYSMQFLQKLYINALAFNLPKIDNLKMHDFMLETILDNKAYLNELINKTKTKKHHLEVLIALAKRIKVNLASKALYNVRSSLEDMGIIKNINKGEYIIVDIFLDFILRYGNASSFEIIEKDIKFIP